VVHPNTHTTRGIYRKKFPRLLLLLLIRGGGPPSVSLCPHALIPVPPEKFGKSKTI